MRLGASRYSPRGTKTVSLKAKPRTGKAPKPEPMAEGIASAGPFIKEPSPKRRGK